MAQLGEPIMKTRIFSSFLLFLITYAAVLAIWLQIKPYYGYGIAQLGIRLATGTGDTHIKTISRDGDAIQVVLLRKIWSSRNITEAEIPLTLRIASYTFNVPITFAIMAALRPFIRWPWMILVEAAAILVCIHMLYVLFFTVRFSLGALSEAGVIAMPSLPFRMGVQFIWLFINNLVLRFEPFLVAVYIYFRQTARSHIPPTAVKSKKPFKKRLKSK